MAEPRQKLAEGVRRVCALRDGRASNENMADEAWAVIKNGIIVARKDLEALDAHPEQAMRCVLEFLVQRGLKRRTAKGQVNECLRIVLARPRWLREACACQDLKACLKEAFLGYTDMQELLDAGPPKLEAKQDSKAGGMPVPRPEKQQDIRHQLQYGRDVMKFFNWEFPRDPLGTKLDQATEGFQSFLEGTTALTTATGKAAVGGDVAAFLQEFQPDWKGILQFLVSMYNSGVRTTYSARIKFVVVNLRSFSPSFRDQALSESLPWGHEPLPTGEAPRAASRVGGDAGKAAGGDDLAMLQAKDEAGKEVREAEEAKERAAREAAQRRAEEERARQKAQAEAAKKQHEKEDYDLAFELQVRELARRKAEDEARKQRARDDTKVARQWQEQDFAKPFARQQPVAQRK